MGEKTNIKCTIIKCSKCKNNNVFNQAYLYHAGFGDQGFLYNDEGNQTITWSCFDPAYEKIVGKQNPWMLTKEFKDKFEKELLPAPKGGNWRFSNPARCLTCKAQISGAMDSSSIQYLLYDGSIETCDYKNKSKNLALYLKNFIDL